MIKLVASDLDGTLLMKGAQSLPEDIFPLIRQLKDLDSFYSGKRTPVCQHEKNVCSGSR